MREIKSADILVMLRVIYHLQDTVYDLFDNAKKSAIFTIQGNKAREKKAEVSTTEYGNPLAMAKGLQAFFEKRGMSYLMFSPESRNLVNASEIFIAGSKKKIEEVESILGDFKL